MRRKRNHNKKKRAVLNDIPKSSQIIFTIPIVKTLKDALTHFEAILLTNDGRSITNLELARITFYGVKQKITEMLECEEWSEGKPLDYNEIWVLYTSLTLYIVVLQERGDETKIALCLELRKQFNAIIETTK